MDVATLGLAAPRTCPSRKSYPRVAMMQSGQDLRGDDGPSSLDGASSRRASTMKANRLPRAQSRKKIYKSGRARQGRARKTCEQTWCSLPRSKHYKTELCSPCDRFGPTVRIQLGENGGNVKLGGVEGDSQPTCDCFVGSAVRHRSKHFELAGR
jgi:hypothetical protein